MAEFDFVWTPSSIKPLEITTLWPDKVLRLDGVWIKPYLSGGEGMLFVEFSIFRLENPTGRMPIDPEPVIADWERWFEESGINWEYSDSAGSDFDFRGWDVFTRRDLDAIGVSVDAAGFSPVAWRTHPTRNIAWPPQDLSWIDITLVAGESTAEAPTPVPENERQVVVRVKDPLKLQSHHEQWPFRWATQGFREYSPDEIARIWEQARREWPTVTTGSEGSDSGSQEP